MAQHIVNLKNQFWFSDNNTEIVKPVIPTKKENQTKPVRPLKPYKPIKLRSTTTTESGDEGSGAYGKTSAANRQFETFHFNLSSIFLVTLFFGS